MKAADIFPGKYLRAADIHGKEPIVKIDRVAIETLGDESKPVLYFHGKEKGVVMNKTNWDAVVELTGEDDSDAWQGAKVRLVVRKVDFKGKRVDSIRIEEATAKKREPEPVIEDDDQEDPIPF
jgi:hypothetical protein